MAVCAACQDPILDRWMLKALGKTWHEDCLKCACCECRLGELGSKLYYKQSMMLCARDYLRLFGSTGVCAACQAPIPAFELVMRARSNVYHLSCFACHICSHRFCVGDKYYLVENKILCQYDYEERITFEQAAFNSNSFTEISRNIQQLGNTDFDQVETGVINAC